MSINHAALRFVSPQLHSGAQLVSLFSKCGSRVHASRRLHGRACYFNTDGIESSGIAHEFGGCTFGKHKFIKKKPPRHGCKSLRSAQCSIYIPFNRTSHVTLVPNKLPSALHQNQRGEGRRRHAISMTQPTADARWLTKNCCRCLKFVTFPTLRVLRLTDIVSELYTETL